ncbi:PH domain-containing protein [Agromyces binzhouensis]|uniref:PH domain-containing protein n=1 Tax=Agromyces binzhouensis TaxID=1817495 RepID=A0A4Q2J8V4_9MICO|nr:PH domain-containing protein [Agromyces binzhouensis]RXZ40580.1 PH domain-containing protein [Agromyces binzhouensis]
MGQTAEVPVPDGAEHVVARLRRHGRILVLPSLLLIAVAGATAYAVPWLDDGWPRLAAIVAGALLVVLGSLLPYLAWLSSRTTVTTRRVIVRRGLFVRVRRELWHRSGYDVQVARSWLQRMSGSGDVRLETGHEVAVVIRDVPKPLQVQAALHELMADAHALGGPAVGPAARPAAFASTDAVTWGGR